jgi:hypothetical protein
MKQVLLIIFVAVSLCQGIAAQDTVSKVFLNTNSHKIFIVDNYTDNKFASFIICENLRHLRHLRAFETAPLARRRTLTTLLTGKS